MAPSGVLGASVRRLLVPLLSMDLFNRNLRLRLRFISDAGFGVYAAPVNLQAESSGL